MAFIILGALLVVLKLAGLEPVAEWPWWGVLAPFALGLAWWLWSDLSGRTSRLSMRRDRQRKEDRRRNIASGMGLRALLDRKVLAKLKRADELDAAKRRRQVEKVTSDVERRRKIIRDSILTTRMDSKFDSRFDAPASKDAAPDDRSGRAAAP